MTYRPISVFVRLAPSSLSGPSTSCVRGLCHSTRRSQQGQGDIGEVKHDGSAFKHATQVFYPNKRGVMDYDPALPMKDILRAAPAVLKTQFKQLGGQIRSKLPNSAEAIDDIYGARDKEVSVEFTFEDANKLKHWMTGCDADWNSGYSHCEFVPTRNHTALFRGRLSTDVPKTGVIERAGWASIKSNHKRAFNQKQYMLRWRNFSHLLIKCRGDGRTYKVSMYTPGFEDTSWGDRFSFPLFTHGGPYWQLAKIPFSKFILNVQGRIQDVQDNTLFPQITSSIGISIMDRIDDDFQLEIDWIGVYNDRLHKEKTAYEVYELPIINPMGI